MDDQPTPLSDSDDHDMMGAASSAQIPTSLQADYRLAVQIAATEPVGQTTIFPLDSMLSDNPDTRYREGPLMSGLLFDPHYNPNITPTVRSRAGFPELSPIGIQNWLAHELEAAAGGLSSRYSLPREYELARSTGTCPYPTSTPRLTAINTPVDRPATLVVPVAQQGTTEVTAVPARSQSGPSGHGGPSGPSAVPERSQRSQRSQSGPCGLSGPRAFPERSQ